MCRWRRVSNRLFAALSFIQGVIFENFDFCFEPRVFYVPLAASE